MDTNTFIVIIISITAGLLMVFIPRKAYDEVEQIFLHWGIISATIGIYFVLPVIHKLRFGNYALGGWNALPVIVIPASATIVLFLFARKYRCGKCGSWKSKIEKEKKIEASENCGGLLLIDPFYFHIKRRVCCECKNIICSRSYVGERL